MVVEEAPGNKGSYYSRKTRGKVPKRIHKAEREKLKREKLNDLFLKLANAIDMTESSGKASILCEATRLLKNLFGQIKCLEKEHVSLLSESHYVTIEKDELKEEKSALETQVEKLKKSWNQEPESVNLTLKFTGDGFSLPAAEPALH